MNNAKLEYSKPSIRLVDRIPSWLLNVGLGVSILLVLLIATVPMDSVSQLAVSIGVIAFVYVASTEALRFSRWREVFRITALILGSLLSLRYIAWRGMYTLEADEILSLAVMWLLYAAEVYSILIHLIGCFVNVFPLERPEMSLDDFDEDQLPTIDVAIPSYNEPEALLEITIRAARMLNYPKHKIHIHLLDDGGTDEKIAQANQAAADAALQRRQCLQTLCQRLGVHYHTRARNLNAKAGNINSAMQNMAGDLIVILDADHVPTTDFLSRTVPWMIKDENVFLVQSPHFMANPDPVEKNYFSAFSRMPSENDMFFGIIQKGLDFWSSSFFCGSAAVLRRKHLDLVGGIAGDSITEDAETALALHSLGYKSVYVDRPMISGLAPETISSFIQQRIRWAQGMVQILLIKKPFMQKGLKWYQKCGYMSSILFWLFPFARLTFLLAPLGYLLFGLELIHASLTEIIAYTIPHIVVSFRVTNVLFGKNRWPLVSELYEILQCTFIFRALLKVIKNPRNPSFLVTPKGETLSDNYVSSLSGVFYWLLVILGVGNIAGVFHFINYPLTRELTALVLAWNSFNFILFLGLLEVLIEKKQLRSHSRIPAYDNVHVVCDNEQLALGQLVDISVTGARMKLDLSNELPELVTLSSYSHAIDENVEIACIVRYQNIDTGDVRVQFIGEDDAQDKIVAFALCDSARWESFQRRRTRPVSYFYGMKHVLAVSVKPVFTHLWMKLKKR
jgi:cellulose synthase (UDP-forming)